MQSNINDELGIYYLHAQIHTYICTYVFTRVKYSASLEKIWTKWSYPANIFVHRRVSRSHFGNSNWKVFLITEETSIINACLFCNVSSKCFADKSSNWFFHDSSGKCMVKFLGNVSCDFSIKYFMRWFQWWNNIDQKKRKASSVMARPAG